MVFSECNRHEFTYIPEMSQITFSQHSSPFVHNLPIHIRAKVTNKSACFCKFSFIHHKRCMSFCIFFHLQAMNNGPCQQNYERPPYVSSSCSDMHIIFCLIVQQMHIHELYCCLASVIQIQKTAHINTVPTLILFKPYRSIHHFF